MGSVLAIGLMADLQRGGIDAALIETDGNRQVMPVAHMFTPFAEGAKALFAQAVEIACDMEHPQPHPVIAEAEAIITSIHIGAVETLLRREVVERASVEVIGYHGLMLAHRPERYWSWQVCDGHRLAELCEIDTVGDFRADDIKVGGRGDPINTSYHRALIAALDRSAGYLDLQDEARLTLIGAGGAPYSYPIPASVNAPSEFADSLAHVLNTADQRPASLLAGGALSQDQDLIEHLAATTGLSVTPLGSLGWNAQAVDAEAMAYLAVRRLAILPIGFPGTTGAPYPVGGGMIIKGRFTEEEMLAQLRVKK